MKNSCTHHLFLPHSSDAAAMASGTPDVMTNQEPAEVQEECSGNSPCLIGGLGTLSVNICRVAAFTVITGGIICVVSTFFF